MLPQCEMSPSMTAYVYILRCNDGRYYVGSTRTTLERRIAEHNAGHFCGWTKSRRPVTLVFHQSFERIDDAVSAERQIKGWSRAKKEALIRGDFELLVRLSRNRTDYPHPSTGSGRGVWSGVAPDPAFRVVPTGPSTSSA